VFLLKSTISYLTKLRTFESEYFYTKLVINYVQGMCYRINNKLDQNIIYLNISHKVRVGKYEYIDLIDT